MTAQADRCEFDDLTRQIEQLRAETPAQLDRARQLASAYLTALADAAPFGVDSKTMVLQAAARVVLTQEPLPGSDPTGPVLVRLPLASDTSFQAAVATVTTDLRAVCAGEDDPGG